MDVVKSFNWNLGYGGCHSYMPVGRPSNCESSKGRHIIPVILQLGSKDAEHLIRIIIDR